MRSQSAALVRRRRWPWGLVVLADPEASSEPSDDYNNLGVAAAPSIVLVRVLHGQEGKAKAVLSQHPLTKPRICAYEGTFQTVSGLVSMSDAAHEDVQVLEVGAGRHRLRVLTQHEEWSRHVAFELLRGP